MKNTLEFIGWFLVFACWAVTGMLFGNTRLVGAYAVFAPQWLVASVVGTVLLVAYVKWLRHLRLASFGFQSKVPGKEGLCFHYLGDGGFMQPARRLFGSVYFMTGEPFYGSIVGKEVVEWRPGFTNIYEARGRAIAMQQQRLKEQSA